jgi:hypothetical protein
MTDSMQLRDIPTQPIIALVEPSGFHNLSVTPRQVNFDINTDFTDDKLILPYSQEGGVEYVSRNCLKVAWRCSASSGYENYYGPSNSRYLVTIWSALSTRSLSEPLYLSNFYPAQLKIPSVRLMFRLRLVPLAIYTLMLVLAKAINLILEVGNEFFSG